MVNVEKKISLFCDEHGLDEATHFCSVPTESHPVLSSAARKFRILAEPMTDFIGDLARGINGMPSEARKYLSNLANQEVNTALISKNLTVKCPVIWSQDKQSVIYFPNLGSPVVSLFDQVNTGGISEIYQCTSSSRYHNPRKAYIESLKAENALFPIYSSGIARSISMDLQDEAKQKKWMPLHRGIRTLARRHEVTLERALSRCVFWNGELMAEGDRGSWIIEVLADTIRAFGKPPTVSIAESAEDFCDMYHLTRGESPGSCMDSTHKFVSIVRPNGEEGRPVDWYHFCPIVKGYYLNRGGVVLARTMVYEYEGVKVYGRVYGNSQAYKLKLTDEIEKQGYISKDEIKDTRLSKNVIFSIPNYKIRGLSGIPLPYFDWAPFEYIYIRQRQNSWDVCITGGTTSVPKHFNSLTMSSTYGVHCTNEDTCEGEDGMNCNYCEDYIDIDNDYEEVASGSEVGFYCNSLCRTAHGIWRTYNMSDSYRFSWNTCPHYTGSNVIAGFGNQIKCKPSAEREFVHEYTMDNKNIGQAQDELRSSRIPFYEYKQGFSNTFVATQKGFLFSTYSFAVSEDEHWGSEMSSNPVSTARQPRASYTVYKGEAFPVEWRYLQVNSPSAYDVGLKNYLIPDNSNRFHHRKNTQCDEMVTNYCHTSPVVIPRLFVGSKAEDNLDFSKPFPILTKDAMRNLSGVDVDDIIQLHTNEVYSWLLENTVHSTTQNITNYLNPIISEENTQ